MMLFLLYVILNLCISGKLSNIFFIFVIQSVSSAAFERISTSGSVKLEACIFFLSITTYTIYFLRNIVYVLRNSEYNFLKGIIRRGPLS